MSCRGARGESWRSSKTDLTIWRSKGSGELKSVHSLNRRLARSLRCFPGGQTALAFDDTGSNTSRSGSSGSLSRCGRASRPRLSSSASRPDRADERCSPGGARLPCCMQRIASSHDASLSTFPPSMVFAKNSCEVRQSLDFGVPAPHQVPGSVMPRIDLDRARAARVTSLAYFTRCFAAHGHG